MTRFNAPAYDIERPTGQCAFTGRPLEPGEPYVATLVEVDAQEGDDDAASGLGLRRQDVAIDAWREGHRPPGLFGHWRTVLAPPDEKKRLFVDDEVLMNLFERLAGDEKAQRIAFRFVLALILMRKRLLRFDGTRREGSDDDPREWWLVVPKGAGEPLEVLNPKLDEERIQEVTEQIGEVLNAELG